jgi:hypothetical protein
MERRRPKEQVAAASCVPVVGLQREAAHAGRT